MHAWLLILILAAIALGLYGVFRWASGDPGIDDSTDREQFRAEQDWRAARRSGDSPAPANEREHLQNVP